MTALRELAELRELVSIIADWKLPETGETWPSGGPVSYATMFGSLGVRDYMRNIATKALAILDAEGDGGAVGEVESLPNLWRQREKSDEQVTEFDKGYEQASDECAEALEAALAAQPRAVPDGLVLVPVEPTDAMCDAGDLPATATAYDIYKAMLAAAPSPGESA